MDDELKPCPFCGAHLPHMWSLTMDGSQHSIKCTECPGRAVFSSSTRQQAIDAWNRRTAPVSEDAARWNFMLAAAYSRGSPEEAAMDQAGDTMPLNDDRPRAEKFMDLVDRARAIVRGTIQ